MLSTYLKHSSQPHRFENRARGGPPKRTPGRPCDVSFFGRIPLIYTIGALQEFNFPKASLPLFCDWVTGLMGEAPPPAPRRPHSEPLSTGTVCQSGGDGYKSQSRLQTACLRIKAFLTLFSSPLTFAVLLLMYTAIKANGTSLT